MADQIATFTRGMSVDHYATDARTHYAVERCFQILGEAVNRLRRDAPDLHARLDHTAQIAAFRNFIVHVYDALDHDIVWNTLHDDLPRLRQQSHALLRELDPECQ